MSKKNLISSKTVESGGNSFGSCGLHFNVIENVKRTGLNDDELTIE
jgi:hypothetical protein